MVGVDTSGSADEHLVTLSAEDGGSVIFSGNTVQDESPAPAYNGGFGNEAVGSNQAVSLYFGPLPTFATDDAGQISVDQPASAGAAALKIEAGQDSVVELLNPIRVEQDNNKRFAMTIDVLPGGKFIWAETTSFR